VEAEFVEAGLTTEKKLKLVLISVICGQNTLQLSVLAVKTLIFLT